jgi:hypothetical protein
VRLWAQVLGQADVLIPDGLGQQAGQLLGTRQIGVCPSDCGPWDPRKSFANCGTVRYDEFFWLDGTLTSYTGWGSATGVYMGASNFPRAARANANTETIVAHEMGHSHGLDDFYDWRPTGWKSWIMYAGTSSVVTETDGWMLRDVWRHVRSKHGYPGP